MNHFGSQLDYQSNGNLVNQSVSLPVSGIFSKSVRFQPDRYSISQFLSMRVNHWNQSSSQYFFRLSIIQKFTKTIGDSDFKSVNLLLIKHVRLSIKLSQLLT